VGVWFIVLVLVEIFNFISAPSEPKLPIHQDSTTKQQDLFVNSLIDDLHKDISSVIVVCYKRFNDSN